MGEREDRIKIEGEQPAVVTETRDLGYRDGNMVLAELDDGTEWYLAESEEDAGKVAREYWEDLAQDDPQEFACLVGEKTLVAWGMGHAAGPGTTQVCSLQEWLDLWLDTPEEHFASYDGSAKDVERVGRLADELGWTPTVAYRHN